MSFQAEVLVRLPDGTDKYLPVVAYTDSGYKVRTFENRSDAKDWVEFLLPSHVKVTEK